MHARTALMALAALGALAATGAAAERGGGIKVGSSATGAGGREGARGGGVRLGVDGLRRPRTSPAPQAPRAPSVITAALVVPHKAFGARDYTRAEKAALSKLPRKLKLFSHVRLNVTLSMQGLTPSPMSILDSLCKEFLAVNVSAILYLMNHEQYGRSTASAQYFLQLAGYLGIPVIAWNADNSGLEKHASHASLRLQLAPTIEHQTAAMLSILERYKWHQFSVVTSAIAGHDDFIQAVRERVTALQDRFKFTILNAVVVKKKKAAVLNELVTSEARVMLLYATQEEAADILSSAGDLHLTGENFVWIVTQSVLGSMQQPNKFPVGMLGVHFDTSSSSIIAEIATAVKVFAYGVESYVSEPENIRYPLGTRLSCSGVGTGEARWSTGERFYRHLRNVSVEGESSKPSIEFTPDGELRAVELKIMNLRPTLGDQLVWEEIGTWNSYPKERLVIKDIVWPGGLHTPPQGVPEKFHMRITFLEEPPYINLAPPDPVSGRCSLDRGVICRVAPDVEVAGLEAGTAHRNSSLYQCCSGFCIDLLQQLAEQLGFTYELVRVEDGRWGTLHHGKWNGLISELVNKKTDMVLTSLIINSDREAVVDFSVPFMETGVAIVVAKRTGIISPTAFLEPFDTASWMLVGAVAIQAATFSIFFFEWLSPSGFDCSTGLNSKRIPQNRFSLCRTYWIVWAVLFQASVHVDSPRGFTARFMTNMWAMFAVVFLAIYTANLAAFMITREEFHELSGLDDPRIARPLSQRPALKFGTVPWSHTDATLAKYFPEPHAYMASYNRSTVSAGVTGVLTGELDAFIYDGTVLDYLVSQDEDCRLLTVGSWYAMSGYGLAFTRNSKYLSMFNKRLLDLRSNGDLERLRRYWMTGTCKPNKQEHKSSDPLALEQFLSAFLLLMAGILLAALLLLLEHVYFRYMREHLAASSASSCCALVSLSMGQSLTFHGAVVEAAARGFGPGKRGHCRSAICAAQVWRARHERDAAVARARQLAAALAAHGLQPPPRRLASAAALLAAGRPHDTTRPRTLHAPADLLPDLDRPLSCGDLRARERTRVEMETVL
ncbi:glutamate receptor ionotropic, NMDA 2B [Vanessa tameamea]|uniref:Glutamate receptor ionotropic, NMDA 2B n=1 Tax=Vanessa tameamea TaxID=334116 RepID=A0A8B8IPS2_VANTA|nr:glutamate receptor ionotropic, NMDA 2B [Vanessa tameamea]XP_026499121.1 glutamate receptor ionotropic, NMDA 2B [Vanessa tameamea]XP_046969016.1 glutamate receptor ionotropic, NMDA 2B [Vanessa cardui]XP_047534872.1 glutamate receptor ionotropic, NMDA 2B [Vanessa atalanta]